MYARIMVSVGIGVLLIASLFAADELAVIVNVKVAGGDTPSDQRTYQVGRGQIVVVDDLELGDTIEGETVVIRLPTAVTSECRVQTQYETSVTIANEGPHLDLLDWVHFTSAWSDAKRLKNKGFRVPVLSDADRIRFPEVPAWELREAVLSRGGPGWGELVKDIQTPLDAPASVDVSLIRLRVLCSTGSTAEVLGTLEFLLPMGC